MIVASLKRPTGELVISKESHPRTRAPMIVIAHHRPDGTVAHQTALQPSEIPQVVSALLLAAKTAATRRPQHRTISAAEQIAEDTRLF